MGIVSDCSISQPRTVNGLFLRFDYSFSLAVIYDRSEVQDFVNLVGTNIHQSADSDLEMENNTEYRR